MVEVHSRPIVLDCHGRTRENEVFHDAVPHASNLTAMKLVLRLRKSFYIAWIAISTFFSLALRDYVTSSDDANVIDIKKGVEVVTKIDEINIVYRLGIL